MMSRVRMGFMLALTAGLLAATVQTVIMPKAYADIAPVQPTFSAGNANGADLRVSGQNWQLRLPVAIGGSAQWERECSCLIPGRNSVADCAPPHP